MTEQWSDYENRDVDYSQIHGETKEVLLKFIDALELQPGLKLLDVGGGYGSVLLSIFKNDPGIDFEYHLLDSSLRQVKKAQKHINDYLGNNQTKIQVSYIHQNATQLDLPAESYDVVVCKMFIHEIPKDKKGETLKRIFSVLKPGGAVYFWNPDLVAGDYDFYVNVIKKKDELAGFKALVKNRHFLLTAELEESLKQIGFHEIKKLFDFDYNLQTRLRLKAEFNDDIETLRAWNNYILHLAEKLDPSILSNILIEKNDDNIYLRFKRVVYKALKPK